MILDDKYITKDMLTKDSYRGNNYANKNAVMFDLQNGKQNVLCFCDNRHTAEAIAEALNLLDNLESDGAELKCWFHKEDNNNEALNPDNKYVLKDGKIEIVYGNKTKDNNDTKWVST